MKKSTFLGMAAGFALTAGLVAIAAESVGSPLNPTGSVDGVDYILTPSPEEVVTDLQDIILNFPEGGVEFYENSTMPLAVLENLTTGVEYTAEPDLQTRSTLEGVTYTLKFLAEDGVAPENISVAGEYFLTIRGMYNEAGDISPITASYTIDFPVEYTLNPENGAVVSNLKEIAIEFTQNKVAFYENNRMPAAVLTNTTTGAEYTCSEPDPNTRAMSDGSAYNLVFANVDGEVNDITEPGQYTLTIRGMYLPVDDQAIDIPAITAEYTIEYPAPYELNPAPGYVTELQGIEIDFTADKVSFYENGRMPVAVLTNTTTGAEYTCTEPDHNTRAMSDGSGYIFKFVDEEGDYVESISDPGQYVLTIKSMYIGEGEDVVDLPVITANYTIAYPAPYVLTPDSGAYLLNISEITIDFTADKVAFPENSRMPVAVLTNTTTGAEYTCNEPDRNTFAETDGAAFSFKFMDEDEDVVDPITEPGQYVLTIKSMYIGEGEDVVYLPVINANYTIVAPAAYELTPESGASVENLKEISIDFTADKVGFYENNRMPAAVLENTTTGAVYNCNEPDRNTFAQTEGSAYIFTFIAEDGEEATDITEPGQYTLTIRGMYMTVEDETIDLPAITAEYTIEYPAPYILTPANGSVETNLQGITIDFTDNKVSYYENNRMPIAVLENTSTGNTYTCDEPDFNTKAETEGTLFTFYFANEDGEVNDINEPGKYNLTIMGLYLGEGEDAKDLPVITAEYTIEYPAPYELNPDNGAYVEDLQVITIDFTADKVSFPENSRIPVAVLENTTTGAVYNCNEPDRNTFAQTEGSAYMFTFIAEDAEEAMPITEPGKYTLTIRSMFIGEGDDAVYLPVITAEYTIEYPAPYILTPESGSSVENLQNISIEFPTTVVSFFENSRIPVAVLENTTTGTIYNCNEPDRDTRAMTEGSAYTFMFIAEDDEEAMPITEPGQYVLTIRGMYIGEGEDLTDLPVITAEYTIEYPAPYILTPTNGTVVSNLQDITIDFTADKVAFPENSRMPVAVLTNTTTGVEYTCSEPDPNTFAETDGSFYTFKFADEEGVVLETISEPGQYTLVIRSMYIGEGDDAVYLPVITAEYTIEYPAPYILTPANGTVVTDLQDITIDFTADKVSFYENSRMPAVVLTNTTTGTEYICSEPIRDTFAQTEGSAYTFTFTDVEGEAVEAITEPGQYVLTVKGMYIGELEDATDLPVITANYTIEYPAPYILTPDNGAIVENLQGITIDFPTDKVAFPENSRMAVAVLENTTTGTVYNCNEPDQNTFAETDGSFYTFKFADEDGEVLDAITEPGNYVLTVRGMYIGEGEDVDYLPVITANYTIEYPAPYILTPDNGAIVSDLQGITIDFTTDKVAFPENSRMAVAVLENTTTGAVYNCNEPDQNTFAETDGSFYTFKFADEDGDVLDAITEPGNYVLTVRGMYIGEGEDVDYLPVITANYTIEYPAPYILTPDNGAIVSDLQGITIDFTQDKVAFPENSRMAVAVLENITTGTIYNCNEPDQNTFAQTDGSFYTFMFMDEADTVLESITEPGEYVLTIRGMYIGEGDDVEYLPVITAKYTIEYPAPYILVPASGAFAEDLQGITIDFTQDKVAFPENSRMAVAVLENTTTGTIYNCNEPDQNTFAQTDGSAYKFMFADEDDIVLDAITEPGNYVLTIRGMYIGEGEDVEYLPVITANYIIEYPAPYVLTPENGANVADLQGITIDFTQDIVGFPENNRMAVAVLENTKTGTEYVCYEPDRNTFAETEGSFYTFMFEDVDGNVLPYITEPGDYTLTIRGMYTGEGDDVVTLPVITANYTVEYPIPFTLDPMDGSYLSMIETVSINFTENNNVVYNEKSNTPLAVISNLESGESYYCFEADRNTFAETEGIAYNLVFVDDLGSIVTISNPGEWILDITGFCLNDELTGETTELPAIQAIYTIAYPVEYNLTPEAGSAVTDLQGITIDFNSIVNFYENNQMPVAVLENKTTGTEYVCYEPDRNTRAESYGSFYTFMFQDVDDNVMEAINEPGQYTLTIRAMYEGELEEAKDLPVIVANYIVMATAPYILTPEDGEAVTEISSVIVDFNENANVNYYENSRMPMATLSNGLEGEEEVIYTCQEPNRLVRYMTEGVAYEFIFLNENDEIVEISEEGTWYLTIKGFYLEDVENGEVYSDLPAITAEYIVSTSVGIDSIMNADKYNVYGINGVQILNNSNADALKTLKPGLYIINGKKVILRK